MKSSILLLVVFILVSCEDLSTARFNLKINAFIKNTNNTALYNGYHFKVYEDGIGKDLSRSIRNDTVIILKSALSKRIVSLSINKGKYHLLDSAEICQLSYRHDQKREIMRSFLSISLNKQNEELDLKLKNWVPQYNLDGYRCIELHED